MGDVAGVLWMYIGARVLLYWDKNFTFEHYLQFEDYNFRGLSKRSENKSLCGYKLAVWP